MTAASIVAPGRAQDQRVAETETNSKKPSRGGSAPAVYRLLRACLRAGLALSRRPVRVLGAGCLPDAAAILQVHRRARFREALTLVAALERPIVCLMNRRVLRGWRSLLGSALAMIPYDREPAAWHAALRACTGALGLGGAIAVFAGDGARSAAPPSDAGALGLARDAWVAAFPGRAPLVAPVRLFWPAERAQEVMIHLGEPGSLEAPADDPSRVAAARRLADGPDPNVCALQPAVLQRLSADVERALRDRLEAEWAARPGRKQKVEGFRLSPLAARTFGRINRSEPEVLVALQQRSDADREARRRWSLANLRAEHGRKQLSPLQRLAGWTESVLGLPVAGYGALNHLVAGPLLLVLGRWRGRNEPGSPGPWIARAVVVLACYTGQIVLVDRILGRAAAGYYALTLPVSGIYLWRYGWLLRRRTRILLLGIRGSMLRRASAKTHEQLLAELDGILENRTKPQPAR